MRKLNIKKWTGLACVIAIIFSLLSAGHALASSAETERLRNFVRTHYHHGLPTDQAKAFGAVAIPELKKMLGDSAEKQAWPNVVYMLGVLESDSATGSLVNFLEKRFTGEVDGITYRALVAVPNSLSLISKGRKNKAQQYLIQGLQQSTWKKKRLKWTYPALDQEQQQLLMMKLSISAAGNDGSEQTRKALERLKSSLKKDKTSKKQLLMPSVDEAIKINKLIKDKGRGVLLKPEKF